MAGTEIKWFGGGNLWMVGTIVPVMFLNFQSRLFSQDMAGFLARFSFAATHDVDLKCKFSLFNGIGYNSPSILDLIFGNQSGAGKIYGRETRATECGE